MAFTGSEDHSIDLREASRLTKNYRDGAGTGAMKAGFFGKQTLLKLLNQTEAVGVRIYYAQEDDGTQTFVLVGTDSHENDLTGGELAERPLGCPPYCGVDNELNS
ncbi:MAG: hypothetical protein ACE5EE_10990 [Fidelibacterota bacterium]